MRRSPTIAAESRVLREQGGTSGAPAASGQMSTSIAKTLVAETFHRVVDRATQMCGGLGASDPDNGGRR